MCVCVCEREVVGILIYLEEEKRIERKKEVLVYEISIKNSATIVYCEQKY